MTRAAAPARGCPPDKVPRMERHAAFLRGMNVGGHRLRNDELRSHFEGLGFLEVATFRASGNVTFAAEREPPQAIGARIEAGLATALGYAVPTFLRTAAEVHAIAALRPFEAERLRRSTGKLQVALLAAAPSAPVRAQVLALAGDQDALALRGRELYWLPSGGILDSTLELKAIERLLGPMTLRTKNTIEQIAAKHLGG